MRRGRNHPLNVSILVLVDSVLQETAETENHHDGIVSILVLVDSVLQGYALRLKVWAYHRVSILVLVDSVLQVKSLVGH